MPFPSRSSVGDSLVSLDPEEGSELTLADGSRIAVVGGGPAGCNHCGGVVSESLVQILATEGINLPPSVVQRGIESYVMHMDVGSVAIESPAGEMRTAALYRGNGPREGGESQWESFDGYLQNLTVERGARVIRKLITGVDWRRGYPWLRFADHSETRYDLVAVASGVNSNFMQLLQDKPARLAPPRTTRTHRSRRRPADPGWVSRA